MDRSDDRWIEEAIAALAKLPVSTVYEAGGKLGALGDADGVLIIPSQCGH